MSNMDIIDETIEAHKAQSKILRKALPLRRLPARPSPSMASVAGSGTAGLSDEVFDQTNPVKSEK